MRAKEFITEDQEWTDSQKEAVPNVSSVGIPGLPIGPTNYYHKYRLGVHMAGGPDNEFDYPISGQFVDDMVMIGYTDVDKEIISNSVNAFGYKIKSHTSTKSIEPSDTNKTSPVANWMNKK
jgi:hypothetical protein